MFERYLEIETLSIVLIGDFNPIILQPFWLANKGLIRENEAENAKVEVIHEEVVKYSIDDWAYLEATKNRFEVKTSKKPYFEIIKDLTSSIFKILRETPIKSLGVNHIYDCKMPNEESYIKLGHKLTPLSFWDENFNDPRLNALELIETKRKDTEKGHRRLRVTPTGPELKFGVSVNVNNHFDLKIEKGYINAFSQLEKYWENSFIDAEAIAKNLFTLLED
jgi:hypothetical protein